MIAEFVGVVSDKVTASPFEGVISEKLPTGAVIAKLFSSSHDAAKKATATIVNNNLNLFFIFCCFYN